jgi:hypothetical protein
MGLFNGLAPSPKVFHSHGGTPIAGWFTMNNTMKMDDVGIFGGTVPLFQEPPIFLKKI